MSTPQQTQDRNQARFVISGVFLLGLAGMAFAAYFLQNVAADYKVAEEHESEHSSSGHGDSSHGSGDGHASPEVSHTGITAHEFAINAPAEPVSAGDVTVSGIGTPGSTVTVTANEVEVKATVGADGNWSAPFEFAPGEVKVMATDGKHPASEATFIVLAPDPDGPSLGIISPAEMADLAPGPVELKGTARPGELVRLSMDGTVLGEVKASDEGEWTFVIENAPPTAKEIKAVSLGDNTSVTVRVNP